MHPPGRDVAGNSIRQERVADSDARDNLAVMEILGQQLRCGHLLGGGHNHAVPGGQTPVSLISDARTTVAGVIAE